MWIGSLYKNGPTQHICISGVHSSIYYFSFWHHWMELTNILQALYDARFSQVFSTLQSVLADLINAAECWWSRFFLVLLILLNFGDRSKRVTFNFYQRHSHIHNFLSSLGRSKYFFAFFYIPCDLPEGKIHLLINTKSDLLAGLCWTMCTTKSQIIFCI